MAEEPEPRVAAEGRRRIDDPLVRAVARLPVKVRTKLLIAFVGTSAPPRRGRPARPARARTVERPRRERRAAPGAGSRVRPAPGRGGAPPRRHGAERRSRLWTLSGRMQRRPNFAERSRSPSICSRRMRPTRVASRTAPDRLGFTPPPEDGEVLGKIEAHRRRLSRFIDRGLIPLYEGGPSRSTTQDATDEMPPLRRDAELLGQRPLQGRRSAREQDTETRSIDLIARNASSFASSRALFIGVAAGALVLALLLGFVLSWSLIGPIQQIDTGWPRSRRATSRARWRSRTATSSARWAPTSTG